MDGHGEDGDAVLFGEAEGGMVAVDGGFEGALEGVEGEFEVDDVGLFGGLNLIVVEDEVHAEGAGYHNTCQHVAIFFPQEGEVEGGSGECNKWKLTPRLGSPSRGSR